MPTVVLKLFAGQGTGQMNGQTDGETDRQSGNYMLPPLCSIMNVTVQPVLGNNSRQFIGPFFNVNTSCITTTDHS